jgi:hypothetical protein
MSESSLETVHPAADRIKRPSRGKLRRRSGAPSQRDLAIFKKVEIEKVTHEEAAQRFGLHRSRVTQVVKRVRLFLAGARADDEQIESHLARQRLERNLEKLRLECALDAAAEAMRRDTPRLVTNRAGCREKEGHKEGWSETIIRDKSPNVQVIKTFLRVAHDLGQLNEREIASNPIGEKLRPCELFQVINDRLSDWIEEARSHRDPPSDAFYDMVVQFVMNLRSWIWRYNRGVPAAAAWPLPPPSQPCREEAESGDLSDDGANQGVNHPAPEINHELTSTDGNFADATSESYRS